MGSIYGPNHNAEVDFYNRLGQALRQIGNVSIVLGGDWNATWDTTRADKNLDILNMANIPSIERSTAVHALATSNLLLTEFSIRHAKNSHISLQQSINTTGRD